MVGISGLGAGNWERGGVSGGGVWVGVGDSIGDVMGIGEPGFGV